MNSKRKNLLKGRRKKKKNAKGMNKGTSERNERDHFN